MVIVLLDRLSSVSIPHQPPGGDVVIIGDDNCKRIDWPLGKIDKLFVSKDGNVRVV